MTRFENKTHTEGLLQRREQIAKIDAYTEKLLKRLALLNDIETLLDRAYVELESSEFAKLLEDVKGMIENYE